MIQSNFVLINVNTPELFTAIDAHPVAASFVVHT